MNWLLLLGLIGCGGGGGMLGGGGGGGDDDGGTGGDGGGGGGGGFQCGGLARSWLATGQGPTGIVSGDFDRDGIVDVATTSALDGTVSVFRGLGGGRFAPKVDYPAYGGGLAVADFDRDGKLDLVSGSGLLLGNDDGSFQSPVYFNGTSSPSPVAAGDFDGDGNPDIASFAYGELYVLPGNGDGTLAPGAGAGYPVGAAAVSIVAADLNHDGKLDLAVGEPYNVDIYLNKGDGTFGGKLPYATGGYIAIGDVTGDGVPDLVSHDGVMAGQGNGAFGALVKWPVTVTSVALIDTDGDGAREVVATTDTGVVVLAHQSDGSFAASPETYDGVVDPRSWLAADLDGDGQVDLALAGYGGAAVDLMFGDHGAFIAPRRFATASGASKIALADLGGDGHLDAIVLASTAASVSVLAGAGDGSFGTKRDAATSSSPVNLLVQDVDGDGHLDVVVDGEAVSVLRGKSDGSLMARTDVLQHRSISTALGDFDSDGKPDIMIQANYALQLVANAGGDAFAGAAPAAPDSFSTNISSIWAPDLDANGTPDLVIAFHQAAELRTYTGNGAGKLALLDTFELPGDPISIAYGDFNGDGRLDLAVAVARIHDGGLGTVEIYFGQANGRLTWHAGVATTAFPTQLAVADVDADGRLDLVVTGTTTEILHGKGDGTFADRIVVGGAGTGIATGDVDGDGSLDLVTASAASIEVLLGTCH